MPGSDPLEYFENFSTMDLAEMNVRETNRYANQQIREKTEKSNSRKKLIRTPIFYDGEAIFLLLRFLHFCNNETYKTSLYIPEDDVSVDENIWL